MWVMRHPHSTPGVDSVIHDKELQCKVYMHTICIRLVGVVYLNNYLSKLMGVNRKSYPCVARARGVAREMCSNQARRNVARRGKAS